MQCQCIQNKQLSIFRFLASKFDFFSIWLLYGCSYLVHCGEGAQSPLLGRERAPLLTTWAAFDLMSAGGKKNNCGASYRCRNSISNSSETDVSSGQGMAMEGARAVKQLFAACLCHPLSSFSFCQIPFYSHSLNAAVEPKTTPITNVSNCIQAPNYVNRKRYLAQYPVLKF